MNTPTVRTQTLPYSLPLTFLSSYRVEIICTIGPATDDVTTIGRMFDAGMSAARINMSHGTHEYAAKIIDTVREVAKKRRKLCPIILDTKGPEIRVSWLSNPRGLDIKGGDRFILLTGKYSSNPPINVDFSDGIMRSVVTYPYMASAVQEGDVILLDDGRISLIVSHVNGDDEVCCQVIEGGRLVKNKGCNLPGCQVDLPHVTEKDVRDVAFGVSKKVEYIAHSFTRSATGINSVRELPGVVEAGISIIAKIESQEGLDNFAGIARVSDGIMVARGDLGVEIPLERVCSVQKRLVASSNALGIPVIVATELLDSMINHPRPTRAEASDVANAVFDGADCVMLSGETAMGQYPVESIQVMTRICKEAELDVASSLRARSQESMGASGPANEDSSVQFRWLSGVTSALSSSSESGALRDAFAKSAIMAARETGAELIIAISRTGMTAHALSKFFSPVPVMVLSNSEKVCAQVLLHRSVTPYLYDSLRRESCVPRAIAKATELGLVKAGSRVLLLTGDDGLTANRLETFVVGEGTMHTESESRHYADSDEDSEGVDEDGGKED